MTAVHSLSAVSALPAYEQVPETQFERQSSHTPFWAVLILAQWTGQT
jgi:hypothetical protein